MRQGITRRAMLAMLPGGLAAAASKPVQRTRQLPSVGEFVRFADPVTETPVVRLTNPVSASVLPAATNRFVSVKDRFLVFSSNRTGRFAPFRVNLRTGVLTQLASPQALDPRSLCLDRAEKLLYFLDGGSLRRVSLVGKKEEPPVTSKISAFSMGASATEFLVLREGTLEYLNGDAVQLIAENVSGECLIQPGGKGCIFARGASESRDYENREYWYAPLKTPRPVLTQLAGGRVSDAVWSADGRSILFLREIAKGDIVISEIWEATLETATARCIAPTSQFAVFSPNADDSVFVGASRSRAQRNIILLLRSVRREFTLCEHRSKDAGFASPVFSPDSKRVYFDSDRDGKPAIYSVNVELLVEPTPDTGQ
ncbi:MAG: PD40 domain-containing protein [Acidobacteriaceae bacterium]|nr:PD40 domain-containing protein [Acidobacteriaceae bacterium]MBV9498110.1 PD40 domain-containing protein [Acidobacteriaceae bacterium]